MGNVLRIVAGVFGAAACIAAPLSKPDAWAAAGLIAAGYCCGAVAGRAVTALVVGKDAEGVRNETRYADDDRRP